MIKGAIFDMDGLMFDSERLVCSIWQEMMDENGYEFSVDIFKNTIGLRQDKSKIFYTSLYGNDFDYDHFKAQSRERFYKRIERDGVPIKKGLFTLLDYLKSQNIKMAVATSTSSQTALKVIRKAGIYEYFDSFVCGDDVKNGKPHPEVFLTAAERIGVSPEECIAFEDSINGIKSAFSANMTTVMVPDFLQPTDEIKPQISFLCKSLDEAIDFIEKHKKLITL
ncbi:MAG: HAD family phosphatase [Ruminococcus sp.]|nr:HAD family phosphatase [Ruminococcus sp.]